MSILLDSIGSPADIKKLDVPQLNLLAEELRKFLIDAVSKTGGHLSSNLGVVELTLALHKVFDTPKDKIIFDVGHQAYIHKILTGRRNQFETLRKLNGLSGFPKTEESVHDAFNTGHSSTSVSAALGFAVARDIKQEKFSVAAVLGDGALTGGMVFEALNNAGRINSNMLIVLNDNEMSITKNVGSVSSYLNKLRTEPIYFKVKEDVNALLSKIPGIGKSMIKTVDKARGSIKYFIMPGILFEEFGFKYYGPIDGHNINEMVNMFKIYKTLQGPILMHIVTKKGKGYHFAEKEPDIFHGIPRFNIETGKCIKINKDKPNYKDYSEVFGNHITELAEKDKKIIALTAAMTSGTGLEEFFKTFPARLFDVGIAEQHAVTFAAGLAISGLKPIFAVYSSFLQRAYDQIIHDVALQNLHVIFAVDRAGIVGEDGETHQGIFDISFLNHIPNLTIFSPATYTELKLMLEAAVFNYNSPVVIRYPRGPQNNNTDSLVTSIENYKDIEKPLTLREGNDVTIFAVGRMLDIALEAADICEDVVSVKVVNIRKIKPLNKDAILSLCNKLVVTLEDNLESGGFGVSVLNLINSSSYKTKLFIKAIPDCFVKHGSFSELLKIYCLDAVNIAQDIIQHHNSSKFS